MRLTKKHRRKVFWTFFAGLILLAGIFWHSCSSTPGEGSAQQEAESVPLAPDAGEKPEPEIAQGRPEIEDRDELTVVFSKDDLELDFRKSYLANEAQIYTALYEGLFSYHPLTMEPVPAAAVSWEVSSDKTEWTFTLRENARYWNGDPVLALHFRMAWLSVLDPKAASPYSSLFDIIKGARDFRLGVNTDPAAVGIEARDDNTLVVTLNSPAVFFPSMLCHHSFSPIHPSMLDKEDWSAGPPVSNGPFYIVENNEKNLALTRNELYWDAAKVSLKRLVFHFSENEDEASALWNSGQTRWIYGGEVNLDTLGDKSGIVVNPMFATHYYFIRSSRAPWTDHRVRQALSLSLPWDKIREGHFEPAKTLIYPIPGYPEIKGIEETDIEKAKELLTEAGFPGGAGLPELVMRITPSPEAERVTELMASTWREKLGVPVKVEVVPYQRYFEALKTDGYEVGFSTWIGDFADPYTFLQMWQRNSNLNDALHNDDDFEALIEKSMREEGEDRWKTLAEAEELLLARGTVLPISYSPAINIVDIDELSGWFINALNIHPFKYLAFKARKPLPGVA